MVLQKMKIYVINLITSTARRESIDRCARDTDLSVEFIDAVDGRTISSLDTLGYSMRANRKQYGRLLSAGEVGCYASHLKVANYFLSTGDEHCVVLEDDAFFDRSFADFLNNFTANIGSLPKNLQLVNLGKSAKANLRSKKPFQAEKIALFETYRFPTTSRGILWSKSGAKDFVKNGAVIAKPLDHYFKDWLTRTPGGYCLDEPIIRSAQFASDIGQGTGRLELSLMEGIRHDIARGKRDLVNDYKTFVRKYFTRT